MSYLLYSSDEMFSATELLRKSKSIFDRITTKVIDKAIILRDGRPTFILFNFKEYERIMGDYEKYKTFYDTYSNTYENTLNNTESNKYHISLNEIIEKDTINDKNTSEDYIEATPLTKKNNDTNINKLDGFEINISASDLEEIPSSEIKEFWNK